MIQQFGTGSCLLRVQTFGTPLTAVSMRYAVSYSYVLPAHLFWAPALYDTFRYTWAHEPGWLHTQEEGHTQDIFFWYIRAFYQTNPAVVRDGALVQTKKNTEDKYLWCKVRSTNISSSLSPSSFRIMLKHLPGTKNDVDHCIQAIQSAASPGPNRWGRLWACCL